MVELEKPLVMIVDTLRNRSGRSYVDAAKIMEQELKGDFTIDMFKAKFRRPEESPRYQLQEVLALVHAYHKDLTDDERIRASEALQIFSETRMKLEDYKELEKLFPAAEFKQAWRSISPGNSASTADDISPYFKPLYPQYFIGRDQDVQNIKARLAVNTTVAPERLTVIRGWPGVGKTTFVNKLVHDDEIEAVFSDGVLWASIGEGGSVLEVLRKWARQLGAVFIEELQDLQEIVDRLRAVLQGKSVLLVVDDIWEAVDGMWFKQIAVEKVPLLLTTRFTQIALEIAGVKDHVYILEVLSEAASMELFSVIAPTAVHKYEPQMRSLARTLEGLPLALRVAGSLIEREESFGLDTAKLIRDLDESYELIKHDAPSERFDEKTGRTPTIELLFQRSVETLDEDGQLAFTYLGAFAPKPATFDLAAIKAIWEVDDPVPYTRSLIMRGLLEPVLMDDDQRFQMHYTLSMYASLLLDKLEEEEEG